jgi:hypothetical protein
LWRAPIQRDLDEEPALLALAPVAVAVTIAGCGGSGSSAPSYGGAKGKPSSPSVTLNPAKLGGLLADGKGRTLYLFEAIGPA